jgi:quinol monooxygenase YgiN
MFYHIVMMRLSERADAAFHARVEAYAERVRRECRGLLHYDYGSNLADRGGGYDRAMLSVFESSSAHDAYQVSPVHQEMKAYMTPFIADLVVCDSDCPLPVPGDPPRR